MSPAPSHSGGPYDAQGMPEDEVSFARVATVLLEGRRLIVGLAILLGLLGFTRGITSPKVYKASTKFVTQQSSSAVSTLATNLAGRLGVSVPAPEANEGPQFYRELFSSRVILAPLLRAKYELQDSGAADSVVLLDLLRVAGTPAIRLDRGVRRLRSLVTSSISRETNTVTVTVTTRWPEISYQIADALLREVQNFNLETRQSQARAEREFLEQRVEDARKELRSSEADLQAFLQQNRQFENSPELVFHHERLNRQVTMRQQIYTSLSDSYEQARIREVQDTPVITVLEPPMVPPVREGRGTVLKTLLGLVFGGMTGLGLVLVRRSLDGRQDPELVALKDAWADTKGDLRHFTPWRR